MPKVEVGVQTPDFTKEESLEWEVDTKRFITVEKTEKENKYFFRDGGRKKYLELSPAEWLSLVNSVTQIDAMVEAMDTTRKRKNVEKNPTSGGEKKTKANGPPPKRTLYRFLVMDESNTAQYTDRTWYRRKQSCITAGVVKAAEFDAGHSVVAEKYAIQFRTGYDFMTRLYNYIKGALKEDVTVELLSTTFAQLYNGVMGFGHVHFGQVLAECAVRYLKDVTPQNYDGEKDDLEKFLNEWWLARDMTPLWK